MILGGHMLWFIFSRLFGGYIGFINLYIPIESQSKNLLWETILRELSNSCWWILLGDFNIVERRFDKSNTSGRSIPAHKIRLFNNMKDTLQVQEEPLTSSSLLFSWDNAWTDNNRFMTRLYWYYIFPELVTSHKNPRIQNYRQSFQI